MKLFDLAKLAGLSENGLSETDITGLALDSRAVKSGYLFAAIAGTQVHGREFINDAVAAGAAAILSDQPVENCTVPVILASNPAQALAKMAAGFYAGQPKTMVAITGTNGKSSTVEFLRQIWQSVGREAACVGTLGITTKSGLSSLGYTTPDCIRLHQSLAQLSADGITDCALEASSHGLDQYRVDGVSLFSAGFTNLTQDHFDYHNNFDDYFMAKQRLFRHLVPKTAPVVINVDDQYGAQLADICQAKGLQVWRVGWSGDQIKLLEIQPIAHGQKLYVRVLGANHRLVLPLVGEFQAANALMALGLALQTGVEVAQALRCLEKLHGVRGRLELAAMTAKQVPVLVDFAHSPDGLQKLLQSVRPHTKGRIVLVFGCGGDRDPKKRPLMGEIASEYADFTVITDDNPRSENPANIRVAILDQAPGAVEIADRRQAIAAAMIEAKPGDLIVVAGKGHEQDQIIGDQVFTFDDAQVIRELVEEQA